MRYPEHFVFARDWGRCLNKQNLLFAGWREEVKFPDCIYGSIACTVTILKPDMPCNPSTFRKKFREAIASVEGVRMLTPHSCRHTFVSQMQAIGVDLATIQSIVGHADVDMTKHYLHVQDPVRQAAIEKFAAAFSSRPASSHLNILDLLESS